MITAYFHPGMYVVDSSFFAGNVQIQGAGKDTTIFVMDSRSKGEKIMSLRNKHNLARRLDDLTDRVETLEAEQGYEVANGEYRILDEAAPVPLNWWRSNEYVFNDHAKQIKQLQDELVASYQAHAKTKDELKRSQAARDNESYGHQRLREKFNTIKELITSFTTKYSWPNYLSFYPSNEFVVMFDKIKRAVE